MKKVSGIKSIAIKLDYLLELIGATINPLKAFSKDNKKTSRDYF
jgi:hypothetical protein